MTSKAKLETTNFATLMASGITFSETIAAPATPPGESSIAVIRLSGPQAVSIADKHFRGNRKITDLKGYEAAYGTFTDSEDKDLDEVVIVVFKAPHSFTGEDIVEISTHGSPFIVSRVLESLVKSGASLARPGEFTQRAFINGRIDLVQAEAVADMISANSSASLELALTQMKGGVSNDIKSMRSSLLDLASLLELELDFSEEDVEFADRTQLKNLIEQCLIQTKKLSGTFRAGNALRTGIPVAIAGKPNAGKSTLLNTILQEERAIVSEIPGTTRDTVEEEITINGVRFRFIDTAGIRDTTDLIEKEGVSRSLKKMETATVILYLFDLSNDTTEDINSTLKEVTSRNSFKDRVLIPIGTKSDLTSAVDHPAVADMTVISAKTGKGLDILFAKLEEIASNRKQEAGDHAITNIRHKTALDNASDFLQKALNGLTQGISTDLIASDIRSALFHLGEITGEVSTDEILGNIFSRFCIGK